MPCRHIHQNRYGKRAATEVVGTQQVMVHGKWSTVDILICPVTWRPHPEQITSARRGYDDWWPALDWVRDVLVASGMLRELKLTSIMPKARPWEQ